MLLGNYVITFTHTVCVCACVRVLILFFSFIFFHALNQKHLEVFNYYIFVYFIV